MEALTKQQRKEEQALRTELKAKKFALHKAERAARDAVDQELQQALHQLQLEHAQQTNDLAIELNLDATHIGDAPPQQQQPKGAKSKSERRRLKKEEDERQRDRRIAEAKQNSAPDARDVELERFAALLSPLKLRIEEVAADGHCLYRSIGAQLPDGSDFARLRQLAGAYIRSHVDDFLPYILADADDGDPAELIDAYCAKVESSSEWGGQLEITALAHACRRCITVYSVDAPSVVVGEEYEAEGPALVLSYHKHAYGLGEHYNALVPASPERLGGHVLRAS